MDETVLCQVDQAGAVFEAWAEDRVTPVGCGFLKGANAEVLGLGATAQALYLGKDEPDPVGAFLAGAELGQNLGKDGGLGGEEAVEIEGVFQCGFHLRRAYIVRAVLEESALLLDS